MKRVIWSAFALLLTLSAFSPVLAAPRYFPDIDVCYISRTPRYNRYNVTYSYGYDYRDWGNPRSSLTPQEQTMQRWPKAGDTVTFTAVVKNFGQAVTGTIAYKWYLDGVQVASGNMSSLAIGGQGTASFQWTWDSELIDHKIKFVADPNGAITETNESNNSREDYTNALYYHFHVWQSLYTWFQNNIKSHDTRLSSFDDWIQKQVGYMNQCFKDAVYPLTPNGILEHVRIDDIEVHPDDYPDPDPGASHAPLDWDADGRWGYNYDYVQIFTERPDFLSGLYTWGLHEQTHQLGLNDLYQMDVAPEQNFIVPLGRPNSRSGCVMATSEATHYSDHSAYFFNANLHKRRGYYGEFLYDVPNTCRVRLFDTNYKPLANAHIRFHQRYHSYISSYVDFEGDTDAEGYFTMPNRSCNGTMTTGTGHTLHDNPWGMINCVAFNGVFFCEIVMDGQTDYQYFDVEPFNIAYQSGFKDSYTYNLQTSLTQGGRATSKNLFGVRMISPDLGFAIGADGTILKWDGSSWTSVSSPTTQNLRAIDCDNASGMACVVGDAGTVLIYSNGAWLQKSLGMYSSTYLYTCDVISPTTIVIAGGGGSILKSTDGGNNWTSLTSPTPNNIRCIRFADSNKGIFVCDGPQIWYTTDGGTTWTRSDSDLGTVAIKTCSMPTATEAWACNDNGNIYHSTDGGKTWTVTQADNFPGPVAMDMKAGGRGWVTRGYDGYMHQHYINRFENGANYRWYDPNVISYSNSDAINDVSALNMTDVWAVGQNGLIVHVISQGADSFKWGSSRDMTAKADGTPVYLTGTAVSGSFPGSVYVESTDRSTGFRALTSQPILPGALVQVSGILDTDGIERLIRYADVTSVGTTTLKPVGVTTKAIKADTTEPGLSTAAILVKVAGKVTGRGSNWFTVDDGAGKVDSEGNKGVKVTVPSNVTVPDEETYVRVTGVSSVEKVSGKSYPLIKVRKPEDIQ